MHAACPRGPASRSAPTLSTRSFLFLLPFPRRLAFIIPPPPPPLPTTKASTIPNQLPQFTSSPDLRDAERARASEDPCLRPYKLPSLILSQRGMAVSSGMAAFSVRPPAPAPAARPCVASAAAGGARMRAGNDGGSAKWWAPLLGWSGQPDYIDAQPAAEEEEPQRRPHPRGAARRFGVLTEDKARQLRAQMMETESFHDAMYHSAIASRLASAAPDNH